jgi:hypothetical protein
MSEYVPVAPLPDSAQQESSIVQAEHGSTVHQFGTIAQLGYMVLIKHGSLYKCMNK